MSTARTALLATAVVFIIAAFHTFYLGFLDSPIRYESLSSLWKGAGAPVANDEIGEQFMVGVGKADITGYVHLMPS